jgi:hypothetical protein
MISPGRRRHRSKRRRSKRTYAESTTAGNDSFPEMKNSDLESFLGPRDHSRGFRRGPAFVRPGQANIHPVPPAYFAVDQPRNPGRAQMHHQTKDDALVDDPSDASVAGSSKYDERHQMYGGRSSGSQRSSKSDRTERPMRTRPRA